MGSSVARSTFAGSRGRLSCRHIVPGHIGFAVVPWKQRKGYATLALQLLLEDVRREGLPYVELTATATNAPSRRVIEANGGQLVEHFHKLPMHGGAESVRYRIYLD